MNADLVKKALEKVPNPNILVNLVSRRVRQLNRGGGGTSRPLVSDIANLGAADIALREIIEDKMGFDQPEFVQLTRPFGKNRRPQRWSKGGSQALSGQGWRPADRNENQFSVPQQAKAQPDSMAH